MYLVFNQQNLRTDSLQGRGTGSITKLLRRKEMIRPEEAGERFPVGRQSVIDVKPKRNSCVEAQSCDLIPLKSSVCGKGPRGSLTQFDQ
jgi:hypothetical protein